MRIIQRNRLKRAVLRTLRENPAAALLGPRQCGKTTLARMIAAERRTCEVFDLENPADRNRLSAAPLQTLSALRGLVIIDEIQRRPDLFEILRVLIDRDNNPAKFLLLGSASPGLVRGASESLAGRVGFVDMSGFTLDEVGPRHTMRLWTRGGFPRSFLARSDPASFAWRENFIRTFLERDIPQLGITLPSETLRRFWTMLAHYHGQVWNAAEFARSLGTSQPTARRYLDILCGAYMVRALPPWFENIKKRQVKSPKVYVRDSGLLHALLSLADRRDIESHPKLGASWEGFVIEQAVHAAGAREVYFWGTHAGAELDLLLFKHGRRYGIEIKYSDAPGVSRSLRIAMQDLHLHKAAIVCPGDQEYALDHNIRVIPVWRIREFLRD